MAGVIGTVALVAGTAVSALGQIQAGQAAAAEAKSREAMAEFNAKVAEQEAETKRRRADFEQRRQAEAAERKQGSLVAALSASGVVPSVGAPLRIQTEQEKESELESLLIGFEGEIDRQRSLNQAALDRLQAGVFRQQGRSARTAGFIGAGSTLLTGFGRAFA